MDKTSRIIHCQYADLCTLALLGELCIQVLNGRFGAAAQDVGIIHHALTAGQIGQLGLGGRKGGGHQSRQADGQHHEQGTDAGGKSFHRFHAKGSTSCTPNSLPSILAGKPPTSF